MDQPKIYNPPNLIIESSSQIQDFLETNKPTFPSLNTKSNKKIESLVKKNLKKGISNQDHFPILEQHIFEIVNFLDFDKIIQKHKEDLHHNLVKKDISKSVILDFGDEKNISSFINQICDEAIIQIQPCYEYLFSETIKIGQEIHILNQNLSSNKNDETTKEKLVDLISRITSVMTIVMINLEILQILFHKHCDVFERKIFQVLLKKDDSTEIKTFRRILFQPRLLNFHYFIKHILQEYNIIKLPTGTISQQKPSKTKNEAVDSNKLEDSFDMINSNNKSSEALIEEHLIRQNMLISHHQAWLLEVIEISKVEYNNEEFFTNNAKILIDSSFSVEKFLEISIQNPAQKSNDVSKIVLHATHDVFDLWLVLTHSFLFIANVYGLAISSFLYAKALGIDAGTSGVIQAATPLASTMAGFVLNHVTKFKKYYWPQLICQLILILGNVFYFIAVKFYNSENNLPSIIILVIGRMLLGVGGARLLTRKYVSLYVQPWALSKYSAIFVATSTAGVCMGPGLQAVLFYYSGEQFIGEIALTQFNILAFLFIFIWSLFAIITAIFFKGFDKEKALQTEMKKQNKEKIVHFFEKDYKFSLSRKSSRMDYQSEGIESVDQNIVEPNIEQKKEVFEINLDIKNLETQEVDFIDNVQKPNFENMAEEARLMYQKENKDGYMIRDRVDSINSNQVIHQNINSIRENKHKNNKTLSNPIAEFRVIHPDRWAILAFITLLFVKVI